MVGRIVKGKIVIINPDYEPVIERKIINEAGFEFISAQCSSEDEVIAAAQDALGIINIYAEITEKVAKEIKKCKIIARAGVGYDMINVKACRENGIEVCNLPDYCTEEVADHTVALLMAVQRRLLQHHGNIMAGKWVDTLAGPMRRLNTLTLGIIGFGLIGRRFAAKMKEITPQILAYDPFISDDFFGKAGVKRASLDDIRYNSDIISLHCPLTPETRHVISAEVIRRFNRKPILINVSRGGLIDTPALIAGLKSGTITGAGLDVLETEPDVPPELSALSNVILTPHAAWYSIESDFEDRTRPAEEILRVLRAEPPRNPVP